MFDVDDILLDDLDIIIYYNILYTFLFACGSNGSVFSYPCLQLSFLVQTGLLGCADDSQSFLHL